MQLVLSIAISCPNKCSFGNTIMKAKANFRKPGLLASPVRSGILRGRMHRDCLLLGVYASRVHRDCLLLGVYASRVRGRIGRSLLSYIFSTISMGGFSYAGSAGVFACIVRITDFADQSRTPALPTSVPVIDVVPVRFRVQCEHPELLEFANGLGTPASAFHRCQKRPGPGCRLWFR